MSGVAIRVVDAANGTTSEYAYAASPVRIGRNALNDLTLPFAFVSGWHAVIRFDATGAKFFDLGSTNGTQVNGRRVTPGQAISIDETGGLIVKIGKLELRISLTRPRAEHPTQLAGRSAAAPAHPGLAPPSPQPAAPVPDTDSRATAAVNMGDIHQSVHRLRPHYDAYRQAWQALWAEFEASMAPIPTAMHEYAASILQREFPELAREPGFARLSTQTRAPTDDDLNGLDSNGLGSNAVRRLARSLRPHDPPPSDAAEEQRFLSCVEDMLRTAAQALIELQNGQEQFGAEMGVRTIKEYTALHAADTPEAALAYLLDWQADGTRTQELMGVYVDLMIHQVALINGLMEGVRSVLARLAPQEVERGVSTGWSSRVAAKWRRYIELHNKLAHDDRALTSAVFGPEFARAYAEVGGEGTPT